MFLGVIGMHLYVTRTNSRLDILGKKRKQDRLPGDDGIMAETAPCRVERDEEGEARLTTPNG